MKLPSLHDLMRPQIVAAERVRDFQEILNAMQTASARKEAIIAAHCAGKLSADDTTLLIQAYDLATA